MTTTERVTFSELSKRPGAVAQRLTHIERLRIERRDGSDLILTTTEREDHREEVVANIVNVFTALMDSQEGAHAIQSALPLVFPWVRHLDDEESHAFAVELVQAVQDVRDLDVFAPFNIAVSAWKATARIKADPELHEELTRPLDGTDYGPVTAP